MQKLCFAFFLLASLSACNNNTTAPIADAKKDSGNTKPDVLVGNSDTTVDPAEDFFLYANGGWIKANAIPADQGSWGIGNLVVEENLLRLRSISEKAAAAKPAPGSKEQKIGDFWSAAMDSVRIESAGLKPIQKLLDSITAINNTSDLVRTVAQLKKWGSNSLFADFVTQDDKNSEVMSYKLWQGGLYLPEREYYLKTDSSTSAIRTAYQQFIKTMLTYTGMDSLQAAINAQKIFALEKKLAQASRKIEDLRDPYRNYNKQAIADLPKLAPGIDWTTFLNVTGVNSIDSVIVGQPEFFSALSKELSQTPIATWKQYLRFNVVADFANYLPEKYGLASFQFQKLLSGARERRPRWKRVIQSMEDAMGEMIGQLYVQEFFSATAKNRYTEMVEAIREALRQRIGQLTWMSDSTKQKAFVKLAAMKKKVGYPDKWKDFSGLSIGTESYAQNVMEANRWWHQYNMNKLGKPVDRDEWEMTPQTYNAYYNPSNNEIVLPAGIFTVPGYRDEELDDATVYGYAGASTIGHEITHGFDDQGRQFDEKGNLKSWWTQKDEAEFNKRADVMVQQFNTYEPLPGYKINGKATLGENIADLGGILLGLEAFKKTEQYKKGENIKGLTPVQRYFMGYALGWLGHIRDEQLRNRLLTDVHSPAKYRVNGPFVDVDEFYFAFNVKPGAAMYRPDSLRVRIW